MYLEVHPVAQRPEAQALDQNAWVWIPSLLLISTLGKLVKLSNSVSSSLEGEGS